jgi:outer membrane protein insertion porin family
MKKEGTALISGSEKGIRKVIFFLLMISSLYGSTLQNHRINQIYFKFDKKVHTKKEEKYKRLLDFKAGDYFNLKKNRKGMENLYRTGLFSNIETEVEIIDDKTLNLYFSISHKYRIKSIRIVFQGYASIKKSTLLKSIFSLRKNTLFHSKKIESALQEIKNFLESRGYFNSQIQHRVIRHRSKFLMNVLFFIKPGQLCRINQTKIILTTSNDVLYRKIKANFVDDVYIRFKFQKTLDKVYKLLERQKYYFPVITPEEKFLDDYKRKVDLTVTVNPGLKYKFNFEGIKDKTDLISSIWEKKVFEKWAEKESRDRIRFFLESNEYLNADIQSFVEEKDSIKQITFKVKKNRKYRLGKILFTGNVSFSHEKLMEIITTDDFFANKNIWLRSKPLLTDEGNLQLFYYQNGFPSTKILIKPIFGLERVDINFIIEEGRKFIVDTLLFNGNYNFSSEVLRALIKTRDNGPFIQRTLNEDLEILENFYYSKGYDKVKITTEVSPGTEKSILMNISEGQQYKTGNLVIIGASNSQRKLLRKLFPLKEGQHFNRNKVEEFRTNIENSTIFNEVKITKVEKENDTITVLIKVLPDRSRYWGLGLGLEDRKGLRMTLEYQKPNILNGFSSLSSIFQLGLNERRIIVSYDTPYLFRRRANSEFKVWADKEIYPSYEFERYGVGESILKKLSFNSYLMASLSWYKTELTALEINPFGVDQLKTPFDTAAFQLSYIREDRDDPFNPSTGDYFSSDIRLGFPVFDKEKFDTNYSFIKMWWSFQKNLKFFSNGILTFSVRNGLAYGDMSITERFFAGGPNSFRAVRTDRLGPYDEIVNDQTSEISQKPKGGNAMFLFNLEATFPTPISLLGYNLYYSLFVDIGNVYSEVKDFSFQRLRKSIGFSIKIKTPMGPFWGGVAWHLGENIIDDRDDHVLLVLGIGNVL